MPVFLHPDMNASLPEFMSDGPDWLPPEPGHTLPDPCTDQMANHSVSQLNDTQRVVHMLYSAGRKLVFDIHPADQTSVAQGLIFLGGFRSWAVA